MNLNEYSEELLQETLAAAEVDCIPRVEAFTHGMLDRLMAAGEVDSAQVAYHRKPGVEISGWGFDSDRGTLHAFITEWAGVSPAKSLPPSSVTAAVKRLTAFIERSASGYADRLDQSDEEVWEAADFIRREAGAVREVRLYVLSDCLTRTRTSGGKAKDIFSAPVLGAPASVHVWDVERFFRLDTSGLEREPISVQLSDFGLRGLSVLEGPSGEGHRVYMAILPGELVAQLYGEYGSRLLERNVRSFLQARGAVNKGIKESLLEEPDRFLAYNNGLSATAADVSVSESPDGSLFLTGIKDLQIVNGGQTTASLHNAAVREKADLSRVAVAAKLTVIEPSQIDEMVPYISKYSNTQNKVTGADFSANHPFHIAVEELSRTVWAPAGDGTQKQTRWFYERARGQYADELARAGTPARQRQFKLTSPVSQKFTKTDLAKFLNTWDQRPQTVSLGAEKNFREFMLQIEERPLRPDVEWFHRLIAVAIMFRSAEKVVQAQRYGGYRAQIVTYTLAKISRGTERRINLEGIWRRQAISTPLSDAIADLSHDVHDVITNPSGRIRHVGEWSKKLDCWKAVSELPWTVPAALSRELIELRKRPGSEHAVPAGDPSVSPESAAAIAEIVQLGADTWFGLSHWAKETGSLQSWQRGIAFSVGRLLANGKEPSVKQAVQCQRMLGEASQLGFERQ